MNCIHIVGNRPQFVKLALLHQSILQQTRFHQEIIHTGQHYDELMSDVFFDELHIPAPDHRLDVNQLPHYAQIGRMTEQIGNLLAGRKDTGVIIYGDTNTSLAGALAAKKNNIPIAHVEAGIRTYDESMPEESNRYLVDRLADLNFCPTWLCEDNLKKEGFLNDPSKKIFNTGDIMLDAWHYANKKISKDQDIEEPGKPPFILATIHREENNGSPDNLTQIILGLNEVNKDIPVIMPCHPGTRARIKATGLAVSFELREPASYLEMMKMLSRCAYVITDSGGFCREAFFSKVPSLVIMQKPFWPEITGAGASIRTAPLKQDIADNYNHLKKTRRDIDTSVFGNGTTAQQIADILVNEWKNGSQYV